MITFKKFLFAALAIPVLAACAAGPDVGSTSRMALKGDGFQAALHSEYVLLAQNENDEWDSKNALYFDKKARDAGAGKKVGPQPIKERKLPGDTKWELAAARGALVAELGSGATTRTPNDAAHAQAMFDCWMEEQEENNQPEDIARCRAAFDKVLKRIAAVIAWNPAPTPAPAPMPKAMPKPMPKEPQNFVVLFDFDSAAITASAHAIINEAIIAAQAAGPSRIGVVGHTDLAGANKYNDALSKRRAGAVSEVLMDAGIKAAVISPGYMGEDNPAVKTPDGARSSPNRRVTISVE